MVCTGTQRYPALMNKLIKQLKSQLPVFTWIKNSVELSRPNKKLLYGCFAFVVIIAIGSLLYPRNRSSLYAEYQTGTVAPEQIISPATFEINKSTEEYEQEKELARGEVSARFYRDTDTEAEAERNITVFFNYLHEFRTLAEAFNTLQVQVRAQQGEADSLLLYQIGELDSHILSLGALLKRENNIDISQPNWNTVLSMEQSVFDEFQHVCNQILSDMHSIGILNISKRQSPNDIDQLIITDSNDERQTTLEEFFDRDDSYSSIATHLEAYYTPLSDTISVGFETVQNFLIPNIKYNSEITESLRNETAARVPRARGYVLQNEKIVDRHERISEEHYRKVESLREYLLREGLLQNPFSNLITSIGQIGFLSIVLLLFVFYLYQFRPEILKETKNITIIFLVIVTQLFFIYLVTQQFRLSEYLIPTTIASMLLAIIFDGGVGIYGTLMISLFVGGFMGNDFVITFYVLVGGAVAAAAVRRIRKISQFFKASFFIIVAYGLVLFVTGTLRGITLTDLSNSLFQYSLPNAVLSPLITLGFIVLFEAVFGVTTDISLLELSDLNNPLLRELAITAPGTYHHSIILGNLSECAAEAIGANSLRARVGCYYHDIGKMVKPQYFIENEPNAMKKHESLAPSMSSIIISSHVRKGLEIAEKYKLPEIIKDFIRQHHGTSRISFFYEKALEKSKEKNINPADFCYPGPKPQTRESGIAMLADGVEAATRALKDPSPARIKERVNTIINQRFQDGQLDECDFTVKDLRLIADSFIQIINGIFHVRIEYSENDIKNSEVSKEKIVEK